MEHSTLESFSQRFYHPPFICFQRQLGFETTKVCRTTKHPSSVHLFEIKKVQCIICYIEITHSCSGLMVFELESMIH